MRTMAAYCECCGVAVERGPICETCRRKERRETWEDRLFLAAVPSALGVLAVGWAFRGTSGFRGLTLLLPLVMWLYFRFLDRSIERYRVFVNTFRREWNPKTDNDTLSWNTAILGSFLWCGLYLFSRLIIWLM